MSRRVDLRCYGILDPARLRDRDPVDLALAAARGGITLLQLRDKTSATRAQVELARSLVGALRLFDVRVLVNDRVDVALAAGAAGVHLGQDDMTPRDARRLLGDAAIIGTTVHHPAQADAVDPALSDYAGVGPVFDTSSKVQTDAAIGVEGFTTLRARLRHRLPGYPCCGISGVSHANAAEVVAAGADGVAVIGDIFMAEDVEAAARRLRSVVEAALADAEAA